MLRFTLPLVVIMLAQAPSANLSAQAASSPNALHASLGGRWTGSLRYRDYQDSTRFVSLPTVLQATMTADSASVRLDFVYDDGPGKTVRSSDAFAVSAEGRELVWGPVDGKRAPSRFEVLQLSGGMPRTLLVEMDGEDNDKKARIRETVTVSASELRILKEVRFSADAPWVFRHEYRLSR